MTPPTFTNEQKKILAEALYRFGITDLNDITVGQKRAVASAIAMFDPNEGVATRSNGFMRIRTSSAGPMIAKGEMLRAKNGMVFQVVRTIDHATSETPVPVESYTALGSAGNLPCGTLLTFDKAPPGVAGDAIVCDERGFVTSTSTSRVGEVVGLTGGFDADDHRAPRRKDVDAPTCDGDLLSSLDALFGDIVTPLRYLGARLGLVQPALPSWVKIGGYVFDPLVGARGVNLRVTHLDDDSATLVREDGSKRTRLTHGLLWVCTKPQQGHVGLRCKACGLTVLTHSDYGDVYTGCETEARNAHLAKLEAQIGPDTSTDHIASMYVADHGDLRIDTARTSATIPSDPTQGAVASGIRQAVEKDAEERKADAERTGTTTLTWETSVRVFPPDVASNLSAICAACGKDIAAEHRYLVQRPDRAVVTCAGCSEAVASGQLPSAPAVDLYTKLRIFLEKRYAHRMLPTGENWIDMAIRLLTPWDGTEEAWTRMYAACGVVGQKSEEDRIVDQVIAAARDAERLTSKATGLASAGVPVDGAKIAKKIGVPLVTKDDSIAHAGNTVVHTSDGSEMVWDLYVHYLGCYSHAIIGRDRLVVRSLGDTSTKASERSNDARTVAQALADYDASVRVQPRALKLFETDIRKMYGGQ